MRRNCLVFMVFMLACLNFGSAQRAQDRSAAQASGGAASTTSIGGARGEFFDEVATYEQKFVRLAEAMPAEKYSWRPGEGVRSVGEIYAHVAAGNYGIARSLGTPPPAGVDPKVILAASTDKAKLVSALKDSFLYLRQAIRALGEGDADKPQKMFGHETTQRGAFMIISGHLGEHLGQSIAYARMNNVIPPWTAEMQHAKPPDKLNPK